MGERVRVRVRGKAIAFNPNNKERTT